MRQLFLGLVAFLFAFECHAERYVWVGHVVLNYETDNRTPGAIKLGAVRGIGEAGTLFDSVTIARKRALYGANKDFVAQNPVADIEAKLNAAALQLKKRITVVLLSSYGDDGRTQGFSISKNMFADYGSTSTPELFNNYKPIVGKSYSPVVEHVAGLNLTYHIELNKAPVTSLSNQKASIDSVTKKSGAIGSLCEAMVGAVKLQYGNNSQALVKASTQDAIRKGGNIFRQNGFEVVIDRVEVTGNYCDAVTWNLPPMRGSIESLDLPLRRAPKF